MRVWTTATPQQTTSAVAGAVWLPRPIEPAAKTLGWTEQSLNEFRQLAKKPDTGVRMAPALIVGDRSTTTGMSRYAKLIPNLQPADPAEIPDGFPSGFRATMPMIDMPQYLDYLEKRLGAAGCEIETRPVQSLDEAADTAAVVVNCAGLRAGDLAGERGMRPRFGQHVVLTNPGVQQLFLEISHGTEWTSYFPHQQRVVCGGISIPDRWDANPDPEVTERIIQRCRRVEPRLAAATVVETITGLRPERRSVKVEAEQLGHARCIHNYGHGGDGVTLSWGCAREVTRLIAS